MTRTAHLDTLYIPFGIIEDDTNRTFAAIAFIKDEQYILHYSKNSHGVNVFDPNDYEVDYFTFGWHLSSVPLTDVISGMQRYVDDANELEEEAN